jgi:hypothetical protein
MYLRPVCPSQYVLFAIENQDGHYLRISSKPAKKAQPKNAPAKKAAAGPVKLVEPSTPQQ